MAGERRRSNSEIFGQSVGAGARRGLQRAERLPHAQGAAAKGPGSAAKAAARAPTDSEKATQGQTKKKAEKGHLNFRGLCPRRAVRRGRASNGPGAGATSSAGRSGQMPRVCGCAACTAEKRAK